MGNFVNRALSFVASSFSGIVQEMELSAADIDFLDTVTKEIKEYDRLLEAVKLRDGLTRILAVSRLGNQYMQTMKPWVLVKGDEAERFESGFCFSVLQFLRYFRGRGL